MLAENKKISLHQLRCLLFLDWGGKMLLLLPLVCAGLQGINYLAAPLLGGALLYLYAAALGKICACMNGTFTDYMSVRLGKYAACAADMLFLFYLFLNQNYLAQITGRICRLYLLPDIPGSVIGLLFLTAGLATAWTEGQVRGRCAQLLWIPVMAALSVMLVASVGKIRPRLFWAGTTFSPVQTLHRSGRVFAGLIAVVFVLYETPYIRWRQGSRGRQLQECVYLPLFFLLLALAAAVGVFGTKEMETLSWPLLALMSTADMPGLFLQRWDAVFLAFLLLSLFVAAGTGCHYMERISGELLPQISGRKRLLFCFGAGVVLLLATAGEGRADLLYGKWAVCCLIPLIAALPVLLLVVENIRKRRRRREDKMDGAAVCSDASDGMQGD